MLHQLIDSQMFAELTHRRNHMIEQNPNPEGVGIAAPFVPWIGDKIPEGKGIYFIGIATRGASESDGFQQCRTWSEQITMSPPSTPFWRYIREATEAIYGMRYSLCTSSIAWSNQFEIGLYNLSGPRSRDPKGFYADTQEKLGLSILRREIHLARTSAVVFLGDGGSFMRFSVRMDGINKVTANKAFG